MLIKFKVAGADKSVWINPDHVSGVLASAQEIATVYLVGGVEQRIEAQPEDVAREIDAALDKRARERLGSR